MQMVGLPNREYDDLNSFKCCSYGPKGFGKPCVNVHGTWGKQIGFRIECED